MRIATCALLIAAAIVPQPILGEIGPASKGSTITAPCPDLPHKAPELATLRAALTKALAAVDAIDFSKISISYAQGKAMMNVIKAAHDDIGRADVIASRAETQPTLLFDWYAYTSAVYAKTAVNGADDTLRFVIVKFGDDASNALIAQWRADLTAASNDLVVGIDSTEKLIDGVLESVDKCAFGVVYHQKHEGEGPRKQVQLRPEE
jgi:hypothetical protein